MSISLAWNCVSQSSQNLCSFLTSRSTSKPCSGWQCSTESDFGNFLTVTVIFQKEEEELSKIGTGIGKVFLKNVKEREKLRQWKMANMDPRKASRTPSAAKEPAYRLRYESPINACKSPLRPRRVSRNISLCSRFSEELLIFVVNFLSW